MNLAVLILAVVGTFFVAVCTPKTIAGVIRKEVQLDIGPVLLGAVGWACIATAVVLS